MDSMEHNESIKIPLSSKESSNWLISHGIEKEHWQDVIDLGLYSDEIRKMAEIALQGDVVKVDNLFQEIADNETDLELKFKKLLDNFDNENR